ncbi:MAG: class I SAM-dependent DNA methyltransferase [Salinivirgaceae bacterium]|nr:class I SAM-dependent DNA methyltransferase [Salinivirgaceae bacterium]
MTPKEQAKAAKKFAADWASHGYEKGETQTFWNNLLTRVFGVENPHYILFEEQVKNLIKNKIITNFIDAYIPETRVMIEQKSSNKDLREPIKQSDGTMLTPVQQAKKYVPDLPLSQHPKWIITCNFSEFLVYDMEKPNDEPAQIFLKDLEKEYYRLSFLVDETTVHLQKEKDLTFQSGELVGLLYDKLKVQYGDESDDNLKNLNKLCVRLVFCLYAEDAGIFGKKSIFGDYLKRFNADSLRDALLNLFRILDQKESERSKYEKPELLEFPYVNGGLFSRATLDEIPQLTEEIKILLITKASDDFDWSQISPTIFGSLFESTLNMETRRSGGMHYTSIENIHKVIVPLFMNELQSRFDEAIKLTGKERSNKLNALQSDLGKLRFLDPACGSGNFLTETYLSLRRLENKILKVLSGGTGYFDLGDVIKVKINQFYGIEINDFAVSVAKTALWIAESQMLAETEGIVNQNFDFLPLKSNANIVEGNALRIDWNSVCPAEQLSYIIGNPPFSGARVMKSGSEQKKDMAIVFGSKWEKAGNLDYVAGWYLKCAQMMQTNTNIKSALVSTNSITQGEQVSVLWQPLIETYNIDIDYAYRTFRWDNGAKGEAKVHCVIIGFLNREITNAKNHKKRIFNADGSSLETENINPYLDDAPNLFITDRNAQISDGPKIIMGSTPNDDRGRLSNFSTEQKDAIVAKYPKAEKMFKRVMGADEFLDNTERWCLWLKNISPSEYVDIKPITDVIDIVREKRAISTRIATQKTSKTPMLFGEIRQPEKGNYLLIPCHSGEFREYIPIGFETCDVISTNANLIIPNATNYHFGVLTSSVHMAWTFAICGRLEVRFRYSANIVYNNFPWPKVTIKQRERIEQTAQAILDVRAKYADCNYKQLYGKKSYLFQDLIAAHRANDDAVMKAYGFNAEMSENEIVRELYKRYKQLTANQPETKTKGRKKAK